MSLLGPKSTVMGYVCSSSPCRTLFTFIAQLATSSPGRTPSITRPSTPIAPDIAEDIVLRQLTFVVADIARLNHCVRVLFDSSVLNRLSSMHGDSSLVLDALDAAMASMTTLVPSLLTQIIAILKRQCAEPLRASIRSVASEVRASNRQGVPTDASHFVPRVLKPLRGYLDGAGSTIAASQQRQVAAEVLDDIAARYDRHNTMIHIFSCLFVRYASHLNQMRQTQDSLRRLKKGLQGFSLWSGRSTTEDARAGEETNVRVQMQLDVQLFQAEALALGANVENDKGFKALVASITSEDGT